MKRFVCILIFIFAVVSIFSEEIVTRADGTKVILFDDHTWIVQNESDLGSLAKLTKQYSPLLRKGIKATDSEIQISCEMLSQGWKYTMPRPKSAQAAWGNGDGRTTWYNGFWHNSKTGLYSVSTPQKRESGLYLGDNQDSSNSWRNGGSPALPDVFMFLLSDTGGPAFR